MTSTNLTNALVSASAVTMTTREIAEVTNKQHKHVLRDTRAMLVQLWRGHDPFEGGPNLGHQSNQGVSWSYDDRGYLVEVRLPKREVVILVSGYDVHMRAKIVDRLDEMEGEKLAMLSDPFIQLRMSQLETERRVAETEQRIDAVEQIVSPNGWVTIKGYARRLGLKIDKTEANAIGRIATRLMKEAGEAPAQVPDPTYGYINAYPEAFIEAALAERQG